MLYNWEKIKRNENSMQKKLLSAMILSTAIIVIQPFAYADDNEWKAEGDINLTQDFNVDNDQSFPDQTGDISINGNNHAVNGNNHRGYGAYGYDINEDNNLSIQNVGSFNVNSTDGETIIKLDEQGQRTTQKLNITNNGFNNFTYDGSGPNSINSSIFSSSSNLSVKNSVFQGNKVTESDREDNGRQGGAFQWRAFNFTYDEDWNVQETEHKNDMAEITNTVIINNSITTDKAGKNHIETTVMGGGIYLEGNNEEFGNTVNIADSYIIGNYINASNCIMADGGAIAIDGIYTSLIKNTYFGKNYINAKDGYGGALYYGPAYVYGYTWDTNTIENSVFDSNYVVGSHGAYGGAIGAYDFLNVKNSLFTNNYVTGQHVAKGGAIYAQSDASNEWEMMVFEISNSEFDNNTVTLESNSSYDNLEWDRDNASGGGAIFNEKSSALIIKDSTFRNNKAVGEDVSGGAIFNAQDADLVIIAENSDVIFENNKAGKSLETLESNAIADNGGTIYLNAKEGHTIQLNDKITSYKGNINGNIYINKYYDAEANWDANFEEDEDEEYSLSSEKSARASESYGGKVLLNADMSDYKGTVNLEGGVLAIGKNLPTTSEDEGKIKVDIFPNAQSFNVNQDATLDISNDDRIATYNLGNLILNANLKTVIDANLKEAKMDNFEANSVSGENGKIIVDSFNILEDSLNDNIVEINLADDNLNDYIQLGDKAHEALSRIYRYGVNYDEKSGEFEFKRAGLLSDGNGGTSTTWESFNPAVLSSQVAAQAGALATMNHAFYYAMQNSDNYMKYSKAERMALKSNNKYAATSMSASPFSPLYTKQLMNGFWFKPYATFENVPLKNGPKVSNITYGSLMGYDSEITTTKNGWDRTFTGYVGYNGASQRFKGVDSYLNGGMLGATISLYKGNFFNATTLNAGSIIGDSNNMYGKEDFTMFMTGIANKAGYNVESPTGKIIFQPNMLIGYTFINTFDYTNSSGVRIDTKNPVNVLQLSPGLKLIYNSEGGWQPYLGVNMVWNLINNSKVTANDVILPEMSIKPYIEYGAGVQRKVEDNFMLFGQAMVQNGGRNGIALTGGLRWAVGKN